MNFFKHYKAGLGFLPSFILSLIAIFLAVFDNELWVLAITISILLQLFGIKIANNYYNQPENATK
ncbi:hypothetical protein ACQKKK_24595 [Peribacillus sp. NPDC006672]|uniref:hypothetical protein n=1 Tax=Peribacillus sp. NPDC006672 TaxID=3390606 RepID=UPI003D042D63